MLTKETRVDRVEIDRFGTITVRLRKLVFRGGELVKHSPHRIEFLPGAKLDQEPLEAGLRGNQVEAPDADQWKLVDGWLRTFHTPDVIKAHNEWIRRFAKDPDASRRSPDEFGKTVFANIGTDYFTAATPEGMIDRMVVARTVMLMPDGDVPLPEYQVWPGDQAQHPQTLRRYIARAALQNPAIIAGKGDDAIAVIDTMVESGSVFEALGADDPLPAEWDRLQKVVTHVHTPKVVAAFRKEEAEVGAH